MLKNGGLDPRRWSQYSQERDDLDFFQCRQEHQMKALKIDSAFVTSATPSNPAAGVTAGYVSPVAVAAPQLPAQSQVSTGAAPALAPKSGLTKLATEQ